MNVKGLSAQKNGHPCTSYCAIAGELQGIVHLCHMSQIDISITGRRPDTSTIINKFKLIWLMICFEIMVCLKIILKTESFGT
jgi:hypothetical protein